MYCFINQNIHSDVFHPCSGYQTNVFGSFVITLWIFMFLIVRKSAIGRNPKSFHKSPWADPHIRLCKSLLHVTGKLLETPTMCHHIQTNFFCFLPARSILIWLYYGFSFGQMSRISRSRIYRVHIPPLPVPCQQYVLWLPACLLPRGCKLWDTQEMLPLVAVLADWAK